MDNEYYPIHLVTGYDSRYADIAALTEPSKREYAQMHDYDYTRFDFDINPEGLPPSWLKIPNLQGLMAAYSDEAAACWFFWSDTDAVILNPAVGLGDFIEMNLYTAHPDMYITEDAIGINAGNFIIMNTAWSYTFLNDVWSLREKHRNSDYWEQSAMMELFQDPCYYEGHVQVLPKHSINSYPNDYQSGDLMLHIPGIKGTELRTSLINAVRGATHVAKELFAPTDMALQLNKKEPRLYEKECTASTPIKTIHAPLA